MNLNLIPGNLTLKGNACLDLNSPFGRAFLWTGMWALWCHFSLMSSHQAMTCMDHNSEKTQLAYPESLQRLFWVRYLLEASGWSHHLCAMVQQHSNCRCRGAPHEAFFSQPGLLLLPRLRGGITSAENGDNGMLYAKRQCRGRATMDGKWSQQPEITRVMGRTGSSLRSAVQLCWWECELLLGTGLFGFSAISAWFEM